MFSKIPLPSIEDSTIPAQMAKLNALHKQNLENKIKAVEAQYAPLTTQANAASKLTYSNLMGPQFIAKLMGNDAILANLPDDKKQAALQMLYNSGIGQSGTSNSINQQQPSGNNSLLEYVANKVKNAFAPQSSSNESVNSLLKSPNASISPEDRKNINNMRPGDSYVVQGNQKNKSLIQTPKEEVNQNNFAENVGKYKGIVKEGEEAGTLRAKDIQDLSNTVFNGQTKQATLDNISKIISSPEFEQIRRTPILGHNELSYYQRYGSKDQQNMVGQLMTLSGNVIRDASQDFKGSFRKGEQQLLENMKINPGDTIDAARGKMEQLSYLNQMITQRAHLTGQYMTKNHMSKLQAEEMADKEISGDKIRSTIHNTLNPKPTDEDINYMAQKYKTTPDEIKKRLKSKGIF